MLYNIEEITKIFILLFLKLHLDYLGKCKPFSPSVKTCISHMKTCLLTLNTRFYCQERIRFPVCFGFTVKYKEKEKAMATADLVLDLPSCCVLFF